MWKYFVNVGTFRNSYDIIDNTFSPIGWPPARVVWLQEGQVVDANFIIEKGVSYNSLEAGASRGDLSSPFVCQASNNDVTTPSEIQYTRNVTCE